MPQRPSPRRLIMPAGTKGTKIATGTRARAAAMYMHVNYAYIHVQGEKLADVSSGAGGLLIETLQSYFRAKWRPRNTRGAIKESVQR